MLKPIQLAFHDQQVELLQERPDLPKSAIYLTKPQALQVARSILLKLSPVELRRIEGVNV